MTWIRITESENIPAREGRSVRMGAKTLALFNLGDRFVAVENRCPHGGGPLADGIVGGSTVTCPLHNWKVCLDSGRVEKPCSAGVPDVQRFPVKVEDGMISIAWSDEC